MGNTLSSDTLPVLCTMVDVHNPKAQDGQSGKALLSTALIPGVHKRLATLSPMKNYQMIRGEKMIATHKNRFKS
jgi:hypothetical protein